MATSKAMERVLKRIDRLQKDMNDRFTSLDKLMNECMTLLEQNMMVIKTELDMDISYNSQQHIHAKLIEYAFKTSWFFLATLIAWIILFATPYLHTII